MFAALKGINTSPRRPLGGQETALESPHGASSSSTRPAGDAAAPRPAAAGSGAAPPARGPTKAPAAASGSRSPPDVGSRSKDQPGLSNPFSGINIRNLWGGSSAATAPAQPGTTRAAAKTAPALTPIRPAVAVGAAGAQPAAAAAAAAVAAATGAGASTGSTGSRVVATGPLAAAGSPAAGPLPGTGASRRGGLAAAAAAAVAASAGGAGAAAGAAAGGSSSSAGASKAAALSTLPSQEIEEAFSELQAGQGRGGSSSSSRQQQQQQQGGGGGDTGAAPLSSTWSSLRSLPHSRDGAGAAAAAHGAGVSDTGGVDAVGVVWLPAVEGFSSSSNSSSTGDDASPREVSSSGRDPAQMVREFVRMRSLTPPSSSYAGSVGRSSAYHTPRQSQPGSASDGFGGYGAAAAGAAGAAGAAAGAAAAAAVYWGSRSPSPVEAASAQGGGGGGAYGQRPASAGGIQSMVPASPARSVRFSDSSMPASPRQPGSPARTPRLSDASGVGADASPYGAAGSGVRLSTLMSAEQRMRRTPRGSGASSPRGISEADFRRSGPAAAPAAAAVAAADEAGAVGSGSCAAQQQAPRSPGMQYGGYAAAGAGVAAAGGLAAAAAAAAAGSRKTTGGGAGSSGGAFTAKTAVASSSTAKPGLIGSLFGIQQRHADEESPPSPKRAPPAAATAASLAASRQQQQQQPRALSASQGGGGGGRDPPRSGSGKGATAATAATAAAAKRGKQVGDPIPSGRHHRHSVTGKRLLYAALMSLVLAGVGIGIWAGVTQGGRRHGSGPPAPNAKNFTLNLATLGSKTVSGMPANCDTWFSEPSGLMRFRQTVQDAYAKALNVPPSAIKVGDVQCSGGTSPPRPKRRRRQLLALGDVLGLSSSSSSSKGGGWLGSGWSSSTSSSSSSAGGAVSLDDDSIPRILVYFQVVDSSSSGSSSSSSSSGSTGSSSDRPAAARLWGPQQVLVVTPHGAGGQLGAWGRGLLQAGGGAATSDIMTGVTIDVPPEQMPPEDVIRKVESSSADILARPLSDLLGVLVTVDAVRSVGAAPLPAAAPPPPPSPPPPPPPALPWREQPVLEPTLAIVEILPPSPSPRTPTVISPSLLPRPGVLPLPLDPGLLPPAGPLGPAPAVVVLPSPSPSPSPGPLAGGAGGEDGVAVVPPLGASPLPSPSPGSALADATPLAPAASPAPPAQLQPPLVVDPNEPYAKAPTCMNAPTSLNSVSDGNGRLWGWERGASCAFRGNSVSPSQPVSFAAVSWQAAPNCYGTPNPRTAVTDDLGRMWGWQDSRSCAYKNFPPAAGARFAPEVSWEGAPACAFPPTRDNAVPDSRGRLWGWMNGRSCAFKR